MLGVGRKATRAPRRGERERRRYSDARRFLEQENEGKDKYDPSRLTYGAAAQKAGIEDEYAEQKLRAHVVKRRQQSVSATPVLLTPHATPAQSGMEARATNRVDESEGSSRPGRVGNSGRKRRSEEQLIQLESTKKLLFGKSRHEFYREQVAQGSLLVSQAKHGFKRRVAEDFIDENMSQYGLKSCTPRHLVRRAAEHPGEQPNQRGGTLFTIDEEAELKRWFTDLREKELRVSHSCILLKLNSMLKKDDTRWMKLGKSGVTFGILRRLFERLDFVSGISQALNIDRERWTTSANFKYWYSLVEDILLAEKLMELNPAWNADDPSATTKYVILRPEAFFSGDETQIGYPATTAASKKDRCVFHANRVLDNRNQLMNTAGRNVSMFYLRCGDGKKLNHAFCFSDCKNVPKNWINHELTSDPFGPDATVFPCMWFANAEGSFNSDLYAQVIYHCVIPCARAAGIRNEPGKRGVFVIDGCQTHINSLDVLLALKDAGLIVILRVPHSSHRLQGEDTVCFRCD